MSKLVMVVPRNRARCGRAMLVAADDTVRLGPFRVLATANRRQARRHGNPERDPRRPFGHPPTGSFLVAGSLPPGVVPNPRRRRRFGRLGALVLAPERGVALEALANGRRHVYLHGGPLDNKGRLRPTLGGFRVRNHDLERLFRAMNDAFAAGDPLRSIEVVEIDPSLSPAKSGKDRVGKGKPAPRRRKLGLNTLPSRGSDLSVKQAALVAGGLGLLKLRAGEPGPADPSRRKAIGLGLLILGSFGASGCADDAGGEDCVVCDPLDPACPPEGYICKGGPPRGVSKPQPGGVMPDGSDGGTGGGATDGGGGGDDGGGGDTGGSG